MCCLNIEVSLHLKDQPHLWFWTLRYSQVSILCVTVFKEAFWTSCMLGTVWQTSNWNRDRFLHIPYEYHFFLNSTDLPKQQLYWLARLLSRTTQSLLRALRLAETNRVLRETCVSPAMKQDERKHVVGSRRRLYDIGATSYVNATV